MNKDEVGMINIDYSNKEADKLDEDLDCVSIVHSIRQLKEAVMKLDKNNELSKYEEIYPNLNDDNKVSPR
jgi:hypothetical protein